MPLRSGQDTHTVSTGSKSQTTVQIIHGDKTQTQSSEAENAQMQNQQKYCTTSQSCLSVVSINGRR